MERKCRYCENTSNLILCNYEVDKCIQWGCKQYICQDHKRTITKNCVSHEVCMKCKKKYVWINILILVVTLVICGGIIIWSINLVKED